MLRIFVFDEPFTLKLRLEGQLNRGSLPQYEAALASARARRGSRKLLIDAKDLTIADSESEQAIVESSHSEFHFVGAENQIAELLHIEEQRECRQRCSLLKRIGFSVAERCRDSARPICTKLYRLLHSES